MTFLDNAKQEHRISNEDHTIRDLCPSDLGYEAKVKCKAIIGADAKDKAYICRRCWEREMPGAEPKEDVTFTDNLLNQGYNKGLNDAWELARKVYRLEKDEIAIIFERPYAEDVLDNYTPQEALAKLKAYEESQNKAVVGDIVKDNYEDISVVLDETESYFNVLTKGGCVEEWKKDICKKTGKHIDISSILEQIGE